MHYESVQECIDEFEKYLNTCLSPAIKNIPPKNFELAFVPLLAISGEDWRYLVNELIKKYASFERRSTKLVLQRINSLFWPQVVFKLPTQVVVLLYNGRDIADNILNKEVLDESDSAADYLAYLLFKLPILTTINIVASTPSIPKRVYNAILTAIKLNHNLQHIKPPYYPLNPKISPITMLQNGGQVQANEQFMRFKNDDINDACLVPFAHNLIENETVLRLWLENDNPLFSPMLSLTSTQALSAALFFNKSLITLILSDIILSDKSYKVLGKTLKESKILENLVFINTHAENRPLKILAKHLEDNTSITHFKFQNNQADEEDILALGKLIRKNSSIQDLDLKYTFFHPHHFDALMFFVHSLIFNNSLQALNLKGKLFPFAVVEVLADILTIWHNIRVIEWAPNICLQEQDTGSEDIALESRYGWRSLATAMQDRPPQASLVIVDAPADFPHAYLSMKC